MKQQLISNDTLTLLIRDHGIHEWEDLMLYIRQMPYGRNSSRTDLELVIKEQKGTCSSKHALAKKIADLNEIADVKLILGIYQMTQSNTIGIGNHLSDNGLRYLPEAHSYLKINGKRIDLTNQDSDISRIVPDIIEEHEITPSQVGEYKVVFHQRFIQNWIKTQRIAKDFNTIWSIRERCIQELSLSK